MIHDEPFSVEEAAAAIIRETLAFGGMLAGAYCGAGDPRDEYPVPSAETFVDEEGRALDYLPAGDLEEIADLLIAAHADILHPLTDWRIKYLWRKEGGATNGAAVLGKCQKASGLVRYWADADFVIWLAADHLRDNRFTRYQVESLLFHELMHVEIDIADGKAGLRPHDAELFVEELIRYGLWAPDLRRVADAVRQLPLAGMERGR